ncbi:transposase [Streptomyces tubercidicus]|uniref:transposase n=1 Tax=Streptomyces tubercidicus TaxID=47759 RepID=UPI003F5C0C54
MRGPAVERSSGRQRRHRLNRGGDRQANAALHRIAQSRLRCDARTRNSYERRIVEGKNPARDLPLPQTLRRPRGVSPGQGRTGMLPAIGASCESAGSEVALCPVRRVLVLLRLAASVSAGTLERSVAAAVEPPRRGATPPQPGGHLLLLPEH